MTQHPVAIITGANRGIGLAVSLALARLGCKVVLTGRNAEAVKEATAGLVAEGLDAEGFACDVRKGEDVAALRDHVATRLDRVDILINNAGALFEPADFLDPAPASALVVRPEVVAATFDTNTLGPLRLCQALVPLMRARKYGRIVNLSSGMGQLAEMGGFWPGYRMSKTALNALTRMLADELMDTGIKVNSVCPGWVRTDMGGPDAPLAVEEGARGIVWAATLPDDGPSGGFFRHGEPIPW